MDPWAEVRLRARECHAEALERAGGDRTAGAIAAAAVDIRDLQVVPFVPGTRFAPGIEGCFDRIGLMVSVASTLRAGYREVVIGHEIGHYELHTDPISEVTTSEPVAAGGPAAASVVRMDGYSALDRREVAADAFASEFLCPADWLREEIVARGRRPSEIAASIGVPERFVVRQAARALLLPPLHLPRAQSDPSFHHPLDATQRAAATWSGGPLLVDAGPGTGKTATLVHRVRHLLASGTPASAVLVLTFSNRAAAEVRARLVDAAPEAASTMWIGTFHAFALEVLHRWHARIGRGPRPKVLDRDGGLALLERNLARLPLRAYRNLHDPAFALAPVLRAIERCKDEMVSPETYGAAARAAALDGEGDAVDAALELADIYAAYQQILAAEDALDLGDLVMMATELLESHDDVARHYGDRFAHVLVDEYQDMNAASIRLLRSLCGPGTGLWVVGDERQSIYRFRGAEPGNVASFNETFGGERLALGHNYRSCESIVSAFSAFTAVMRGGGARWTSSRGVTGSIHVMAARTVAGEAAAVGGRIEELRQAGVGYGDQAVLARTHLTLERIGAALERQGVPLLYLGDLFARDEVRDLLALLSIDSEQGGLGLVRVAALAPYAVSRRDALAALRRVAELGQTISAVLARPEVVPGISDASVRGLALLGQHLRPAGPHATAWTVLTNWLFETGTYLDPLLAADDNRSRMRLAAIYQLLTLAADEGGGRRRLLDRVRRIAALGEGRHHGVVAPEAEDPDAVRLMTVHAAKGLEFDAVHLPMAATHYVPLGRQRNPCPPPPDLARLALSAEDHDAEERCLWFVAMSRARDHLTISHARRYTPARESQPSPFLARIGTVETSHRPDVADGAAGPALSHQAPRASYPEGELQTYARCPARYRYDVVDGLAGLSAPSAYRRFRRCVREAVSRMEDAAQHGGDIPDDAKAAMILEAVWADEGLVGHALETYYRDTAERMVARMADVLRGEEGARYHRGPWVIDVGNGRVSVRPDRIVEQPWGAVTAQVLRTARSGTRVALEGIHALLSFGARARFPDHRVTVTDYDPYLGETSEPDTTMADDALEPYRDAIDGIERGLFPPRPGARHCPSCPYFFVCGA